ncbi:hypothetical protein DFH11DRAFT_1735028 [Phellopilus nigrolimitatus]|nr:hypothetical protein DFH11DRAFT_1735028 [Phellopilus nigrolimitatus]
MPFDTSAIPNDVWFEIASFCGFIEVLSLEAVQRLHALDQDHAPDLPRYVSISDLSWQELRNLVVRARRRYLACTGRAPLRPTHKTTIRIGSVNSDGAPGRPRGDVLDMELLPGGKLLLVLWSGGNWTVPGGECVCSYRPQSEAQDMPPLKVCSFAYDMQADDDMRVLVVGEPADGHAGRRTFEILQISPREKNPVPLYKLKPEELDKVNGRVRFAKLCSDVWALSVGRDLLLTFWKEDRSVIIRECSFEDVHFVDAYLIGAIGLLENKSIIAFQLSSIRKIPHSASTPGTTQILTLERDIPYASCLIPCTPNYHWISVKLSICAFHWKPDGERRRKGVSITTSVDIDNQETFRVCSVLDSFLLETPANETGVSEESALLPSHSLPTITHLESPGTITLNQQISMDSCVSRPSQASSMVITFRDILPTEGVPGIKWLLATVSCDGEVEYRTLEIPHAAKANVEFYSGALYFATEDAKSIVIQRLD